MYNLNIGFKKTFRIFICLIVAAWAASLAFGQAGRGRITGLITDPSGAAVPAATIKLLNPATGVTQTAQTTGSGLYSFSSLNPGTYNVTVSKKGFATLVQKSVAVQVDQTTAVNLTLKPGAVHQVVTVTSSAPLTATTNATVGQLISEQTIQRVPLVDRDVFKLVQLSPGITPINGAVNNVEFNQRPGADVSGFSINGLPQGTLTYLEDGAPLTIAENNLGAMIPAMIPPLDSIQEYRVETSNVPATTQSFGTGVLSLVSKSGTNKFHGSGFFYGRPNFWAANDPFVKASQLEAGQPNQAPNFHRYQWGASIGGPIKHDKVFFFGDYEGTTQRSLDTASYTVPTMAERGGDFSADSFTVYNPFNVVGGARQPFANNVIPGNMINPIAQKMAQFYPKPNQAGVGPYHVRNFYASGLDPDDEQKFDIRLDDNLSERQHIFGRFSFARLKFGNANLYGNMWNPNTYQNITNDRNVLLADDLSLTSNTLLQLRYSFTRHYENQTGDPQQVGFDMTSLGFPSSLAAQSVYADIPMIDFTDWGGFTANLGSEPWTTFRFASMDHDFIAALSTIKGRHNLHMGGEYMIQLMNVGQPVAPSGWYAFDNTATSSSTWAGNGSDFASFLLGMGSAPGNEWQPAWSKDIFAAEKNPYYGLYIQDDWHVNNKLTLNLGLRWDVFGGRNERYNRLEWFNPTVQYKVNGVNLKGGEQFVNPGATPYATNYGNIAPRFGLAYHPSSKLVVRGGFGIFYGPSSHMVASAETNSDSFQTNTTWAATTTDAYGNSVMLNPLGDPFPNGVLQPTNGTLGLATNLGNALATVLRNSHDPTAYNFNFGVEYQLPAEFVASAAWVGSRGLYIPTGYDLNQLSLQQIAKYNTSLGNSVPNPYVNAITDPTSPIYQSPTIPLWESISSYPQFTSGGPNAGVGISAGPLVDSIYHSVQLKLQKRMTKHFSTLVSFMGGKMIDNGNNLLSFIGQHSGGPQDWRNLYLERSLDPQDVSHWFTWQASYDLPIGSGRALNLRGHRANFWLGGWTINSVLSVGSGVPILVSGSFPNQSQWFSQRPNLTCDAAAGAQHTAAQWFLPNCYAAPASPFVAGTAPRTLPDVRSDGTHNLDASLSKDFRFNERMRLQFQLSVFNFTNSVQLGIPDANWNPNNLASFGQISYAASQPRQFQFGLRFTY